MWTLKAAAPLSLSPFSHSPSKVSTAFSKKNKLFFLFVFSMLARACYQVKPFFYVCALAFSLPLSAPLCALVACLWAKPAPLPAPFLALVCGQALPSVCLWACRLSVAVCYIYKGQACALALPSVCLSVCGLVCLWLALVCGLALLVYS